MELYIGGCAQGKLSYVMKRTGISPDKVYDAALNGLGDSFKEDVRIFNHFHLFIRNWLKESRSPELEVEEILLRFPELIIISDEVGNGIVPMDTEEREYRERLGRILCTLAEGAEKVERIICGIGQKIK